MLPYKRIIDICHRDFNWPLTSCTGSDHLILVLIFSWETIICSEVATAWDTCHLCANVWAKPEVGISPHLLGGSLSVNVYLQCASHLMVEGQQHVCIDFCFCLGKTGVETYKMLQAAFRESCLRWSKTLDWYSCFKSGRRSFEDNPRLGRPSTFHTEETMERVREIFRADQHLTIREVAEEVRIAFGMCQKILTEDLQMRRMAAKFVPCLLMAEQKNDRLSICTDLHERAQNDPNFISPIITGDECWVYGYDPETKQISSQWNTASSWPKKAWQVKSNVKTMLIVFFDVDGLVGHEYVPRGQMVNKEFYKSVLQCLHDAVRRHCAEKWHSRNWILHHDNAPAHMAVTTNEFLAKQHSFAPTPSLLPLPCSVWLLVPVTEENNESSLIWLHWRDSCQCDETTEGYYKK